MAQGLHHLRFRCTACGNCCRDLRVPLTDADLRRLVEATGLPAIEIVDWVPTAAVDLVGEPESLLVLDHENGYAMMALAQRDKACRFLGSDQRCAVYEARPANCRLYPFAASFGRRGGVRRLRLLSGTECEGARDGHNDAHALRQADEQRWAEQRAFLVQILAWNQGQRHRSVLGRRLRTGSDFLGFVGFSVG